MSHQTSRVPSLKLGAAVGRCRALAACAAPDLPGTRSAAMPETVELRLTFWGDLADMPHLELGH